jgi:hypothetical protein
MPVAVERGEADEVNRIEEEWNDRLTYPTASLIRPGFGTQLMSIA